MKTATFFSIIIGISMFFYACEPEKYEHIEDLARIYTHSDIDSNLYVFDARTISEEGDMILFSVAGINPQSKFDSPGNLYLQHINSKGELLKDTFVNFTRAESSKGGGSKNINDGFLSQVIQQKTYDKTFYLLWNSLAHKTRYLQIETSGDKFEISLPHFIYQPIEEYEEYSRDYFFINGVFNGNELTLTRINKAAYTRPASNFFAIKFDNTFRVTEVLSAAFAQSYIPSYYNASLEPTSLLRYFDKWTFCNLHNDEVLFYAPLDNKLSLMLYNQENKDVNIYEDRPIFTDSVIKLVAQPYVDESDMIYTIGYEEREKDIFLMKIDKTKIWQRYSSEMKIKDLPINGNKPVIMKKTEQGILIGGTNFSNQVVVLLYQEKELLHKTIGFSYPFELAGMDMINDNLIVLAGTTSVFGKHQRSFYFRLSIDQLEAQ